MTNPHDFACFLGDAGELCVRGPQVMKGHWNRPDETEKVLTSDGSHPSNGSAKKQSRHYATNFRFT